MAAVDAGELSVLGESAQHQGFLNDGREVLAAADMAQARIGHGFGGEYPVCIAFLYGHQAVGSEKDGRGQVGKLFLLVLPSGAEVALEMRKPAQFRVAVGREHLAVGVYVDAFALGLLQQQFQIVQVVARDHDERPFFHLQGNFCRGRSSQRFRIRTIEQGHALQIDLAQFHGQGQHLFSAEILAQGKQALVKIAVYPFVAVAHHAGVIGVGSHATHAE